MTKLVIRADQMRAFEDDMQHRWLCDCVQSAYPQAAKQVGGKAVWDLVTLAREGARLHGFKSDTDLVAYIRTAFLLGPDFDQDPHLPWVREILESPHLGQPGDRGWALEKAALKHATDVRDAANEEDS